MAIKFAADGFERREADSAGFAGGEYIEIRGSDADAGGERFLGETALGEKAVQVDSNGHGASGRKSDG